MAKVYVGTYHKYNNGNLQGAWLDLAEYSTYSEFVKACRELHKDERDPEFMIQDSEGFPDGLDCLEWLTKADFDCVKAAMKEEPNLTIVDYSDKAFAVIGETKPVKDDLKKLGGRFNGKLSCGAGWIFPNKARAAVEQFIGSGVVKEAKSEGNQFVEWLNEYLSIDNDDYYRKSSAGAIKLHDCYYLIEKPSIENKFCFHDEGPQYDLYKSLHSDEKKMERYFKSENLATFDNKIHRIEKGNFDDKRVWWKANNHRLSLRFYDEIWRDGWTECTEEEKKLILKGLKYGRQLFEKRLDSYLKKYGVSKLHTWTYWADA